MEHISKKEPHRSQDLPVLIAVTSVPRTGVWHIVVTRKYWLNERMDLG